MLIRRPGHALAAVILLVVEVLIALYVRDRFVRPYLGDVLAVMLVHCALRAVLPIGPLLAAASAFGIALVIELGQLVVILGMVGLEDNAVAATVLGSGFDPVDIACYAAGALAVLAIDRLATRRA
ncbi:DUF2809 domain-containing protein [Alteriqipengyuania sp. NZ-12B]|uniref:DUF2809 domain-containing protein n=1 Tax=Alteriqipengyuania abyssalis TaxID=2860200 RepID=A0ABS7P9V8_9SPHN|nr:DUF2809 domain-containing protein [Alteriqipengyuania abyssalis]MBY8335849.1 DUF2809 domain-containing protein [Alteriqipengyuania abyssalis]